MARGHRPRVTNRPLVKPLEPHRFADLGRAVLAILLLCIPAFLYASQRARIHQTRLMIRRLETRLDTLQQQRQFLLLERSLELDPRQMDDKARELVGLERPVAERVFHLQRPQGRSGQVPRLLAEAKGEADGHP